MISLLSVACASEGPAAGTDARPLTDASNSPIDAVIPGHDGSNEAPSSEAGSPPPELCSAGAFSPCGGQLAGVWHHRDFCDSTGQPASRPMECQPPWPQPSACQGIGSSSSCHTTYDGTIDFQPAGQAVLDMTVAEARRFTLSATCVDQLRTAGTPSDRCQALSTAPLTCRATGDHCECAGNTDPIAVALPGFTYSIDATQVTFHSGGTTATGSFCVSGSTLIIRFAPPGFEGWSAWAMER
jgi:hypothetical protein